MKKTSDLDEIKTILSSALNQPVGRINGEDKLVELEGIDSLAFEMVLLEIEDATGRDIELNKLTGCVTVSDLANLYGDLCR